MCQTRDCRRRILHWHRHAAGPRGVERFISSLMNGFAQVKLTLRYATEKTTAHFQSESVEVKAYQIIVWVSLTTVKTVRLGPQAPKFPAILDIGNNHNFGLSEEHLLKWAKVQ